MRAAAPTPANMFALLAEDGDGESEEQDEVTELLPVTEESLAALGSAVGRFELDDDVASEVSTASHSSRVSVIPTWHARQRADERSIATKQIQQTKLGGSITMSIHIPSDTAQDSVEADIRVWGNHVKQNFPELELGRPSVRGAQHARVEMELLESAGKGTAIKKFLLAAGYFTSDSQTRRLAFVHRRGQRDTVVVEGRQGEGSPSVQIITVFTRDNTSGRKEESLQSGEKYVREQCIDLYNNTFHKIVQLRDAPDEIEQVLTEFEYAECCDGTWFVGPFKLADWPENKPFLLLAATYGRTKTVERLVRVLGIAANRPDKKFRNTALHIAAYWGHEDTVAALLQCGADPGLRNKGGETALGAAQAGQSTWVACGRADRPGQRLNIFKSCFSDMRPPTWDGILRRLEGAVGASTPSHTLPGEAPPAEPPACAREPRTSASQGQQPPQDQPEGAGGALLAAPQSHVTEGEEEGGSQVDG